MLRDRLTRSGLRSSLSARTLGLAVAGLVFVWLSLGPSLGAFGVGIARGASVGQVTEFPISTADTQPGPITAGPDGNLWFSEQGAIGRITPSGEVTAFPVHSPTGIEGGPDGNIWFTTFYGTIGRITPSGSIT